MTAPQSFRDRQLAIVRVNDLNMRTAPSISAPRLLDKFDGDRAITLDAGDRVLIVAGPVEADGIWWFAVARGAGPLLLQHAARGGMGCRRTSADPWVDAEETGPCAVVPPLANLVAAAGIIRLGCYGPSMLTFDAHQASNPGGLGGLCPVEPAVPKWLMCDNINYNWVNGHGSTDWLFLLHFDPTRGVTPTDLAPMGTTGPPLRISGHFGDPAAEDCVTASDPGSLEAMSQWLTCAARFVVESVEPGS